MNITKKIGDFMNVKKIYLTVITDNFEEQGFGLSKARGGKTQCL